MAILNDNVKTALLKEVALRLQLACLGVVLATSAIQAEPGVVLHQTHTFTGKALFGFSHSNQLVANQKLVPEEINITMIPNQADGKPGQYLKPSMLLSIAETSGDKEAAAELLNFFITDKDNNPLKAEAQFAALRDAIIEYLDDDESEQS